jgi:hypothetical protein
MCSNEWETFTRRNPKTREGITASQCNPHIRPNTQGLLIVFKRLGTREVFIRTYDTRTLQGLTTSKGWYSSTSPSLNPTGATIRDTSLGYPHRPYIWPVNGGRPRRKPVRTRRNYQLGDHDILRISISIAAMVG